MTEIAKNIFTVRMAIEEAAREFDRDPAEIRLLAVSKTRPAEELGAAINAGQHAFGENYLQEARDKISATAHAGVEWHFIGQIQSNKTRELAEHFGWVQTVDRARIARRLDAQRPDDLPPLNICLQVNLDREPQKGGLQPEQLLEVADEVRSLSRLRLRGLMAIPAPRKDFSSQREAFAALRELFNALRAQGHAIDTLSMGMSGDMRAAIAEGSTMVRIGAAIFGERTA